MIKIITYRIDTNFNAPYTSFTAGNFIQVYFDDSTETFNAQLTADFDGNSILSSISSGPNLFYGDGGTVTRVYPSSSSNLYQYCDGTDLKYARVIPYVPYGALQIDLNSDLCEISPVCDLRIQSEYTVKTVASGPSTADGSISVSAISSNGTIKYSLTQGFDYDTEGQLTGDFANLLPGDYTVYAKDGLGGCIASVDITIEITKEYGIRWQMLYKDANHMRTRINILERAFTGDLEIICGGELPIVITYNGDENNPYQSIISSVAELQLLTEKNNESYFDDLFTTDDRKYLIRFYKETGETQDPIPVPEIDDLVFASTPTLTGLSDYLNDTFTGALQSWGTGSPFTLGRVSIIGPLTPQSTKYFLNDFISSAGYTYDFTVNLQYITVGASDHFDGYFEIVLLDASNVIVGSYSLYKNVYVTGSPSFAQSFSISPTNDTVKIGIRVKRNIPSGSNTVDSIQLVSMVFDSWDATTLVTEADVPFITGNEYSFDYDFTASSAAGVITIDVINALNVTVLPSYVLTGATSYIGNYRFTAPAGATKIRITATDGSTVSFNIVSFVRIPLPVETDGFSLEWTGFVIPQFNTQPWLKGPFYTVITATDGLGDLKNYDFLDSNGNVFTGEMSCIRVLSEMLGSTSLEINMRSCINVFDSDMDETSNGDPLAQAFIDPDIFYSDDGTPKDCEFVVKALLDPLGARIYQSKGVWWFERVEYSVSTTKNYREFDWKGIYIGYAVQSANKNIDVPTIAQGFVWTEKSQTLSFIGNYGTFKLTHNLAKDGNLIDEGRFESKDLEPIPGGQFFKNWNIFLGQSGMTYGLQNVDSNTSTGAFYASYETITNRENDSYIYNNPVPIELDPGDKFKIFFSVSAIPYFNVEYVRVAWRCVVTNNDNGDIYEIINGQVFVNPIIEQKNEIFIEKFNEFKDIELGPFGFNFSLHNATIQLFLYFHNHAYRDYTDLSTFKSVGTAGVAIGTRRIYYSDGPNTYYYKTQATDVPDLFPQVVQPDDYNVSSNPVKWVLQESYFLGQAPPLTQTILFDNVKISTYSMVGGVLLDPADSIIYQEVVTKSIKNTYKNDYYLGDAPQLNNAPEIYKGYFRFEDGTPTDYWHRHGVSEALPILSILLNDYKTQLASPCRKLYGTGKGFSVLRYINFLIDTDTGDRYTHTNLVWDDINCFYTVNLINIKTGGDGEPPVDLSSHSLGFSLGYDA